MAGPQSTLVFKLLAEQRRRALATILGAAESAEWWMTLSATQQVMFREQTRAAIGAFYDFARDVVKVTEEDGSRNDVTLDLIRAIHRDQRELVQKLGA